MIVYGPKIRDVLNRKFMNKTNRIEISARAWLDAYARLRLVLDQASLYIMAFFIYSRPSRICKLVTNQLTFIDTQYNQTSCYTIKCDGRTKRWPQTTRYSVVDTNYHRCTITMTSILTWKKSLASDVTHVKWWLLVGNHFCQNFGKLFKRKVGLSKRRHNLRPGSACFVVFFPRMFNI